MDEKKELKKKDYGLKNPDTIKVKYRGVGVRGWIGIGKPKKGETFTFPFDKGDRLCRLNPKFWERVN